MNSFAVEWAASAEDELALLWMQAADRQAVNAAQVRADQLLAADPVGNGHPLSEGLYRLTVPPLKLIYTIDEQNRRVEVAAVGPSS
jgi:mRNA-degrading endonuclease RelE of RelBE toxin-antitoxin system